MAEMPMAVHEFILTDFKRVVQPALDRLPLDRYWFRTTLEGNLSMWLSHTGFSTTPNLALVTEAVDDGLSLDLLGIVECAFSQDRSELMEKVKNETEGWPDIAFVIVILVLQAQDYHSPKDSTPTWTFFSQQDGCLAPNDFLRLPSTIDKYLSRLKVVHLSPPPSTSAEHPDSPKFHSTEPAELTNEYDSEDSVPPPPLELSPINIVGHTWCHISSIKYRIWVRQDGNNKIAVDRDGYTSGVSHLSYHVTFSSHTHVISRYPTITMEEAESMIQSGLSAAKRQIVQFFKNQHLTFDAHRLRRSSLVAKFNW